MERKRIVMLILCVSAVTVGGVTLLLRDKNAPLGTPAQAQSPAPAFAVQTTTPERRAVSRLLALPGDLRPMEEATLYAKVPGYLGSLRVDKGDRVKAGQILATIQSPELDADRTQAQQSYQSEVASAQGSRASQSRAAVESPRARIGLEKSEADRAQAAAAAEKARLQHSQLRSAVEQAQLAKTQAEEALGESQAQVEKAQADLEAAKAEQNLAALTFERYDSIYRKDRKLIARQDVDVAESKAKAARSRTTAAQSQLEVTLRRQKVADAVVKAAQTQIDQTNFQAAAAQEGVKMAEAQLHGLEKQVEMARKDIALSQRQQEIAGAKTRETKALAEAGKSAAGKFSALADYAQIRAPFDGIITKRFVDPGAFIQTAASSQNAAAIVTVANLNRLRLDVNVPEGEARFVRVGTPVAITLAGLPDTILKGTVARTSASLDPKTRTLLAEIELPNPDGKLLPGAYAMAKVALETHPNVISIPSAAVGSEKSGKFVFIVENGKAKRVGVTVGFDDGAVTEIADGLHGGETVIVTGRDNLTPGASVTTTSWTPAAKK